MAQVYCTSIRRIKSLSCSTAGTGSMDRPIGYLAMVPLRQRRSIVLPLSTKRVAILHHAPSPTMQLRVQELIVQYFQLGPSRRSTADCHPPKRTTDEWRNHPATVPTTFVEYLQTLPKDAQWALQDINLTDDGLTIAQAIRGSATKSSESIVQYFQLGPSRRSTADYHLPKRTTDIRVRVGHR
jgi:hypothetical protein